MASRPHASGVALLSLGPTGVPIDDESVSAHTRAAAILLRQVTELRGGKPDAELQAGVLPLKHTQLVSNCTTRCVTCSAHACFTYLV